MTKKPKGYLPYINNLLIKFEFEEINFINEINFYNRYYHLIFLNALWQGVFINYKELTRYLVFRNNLVPASIMMKAIEDEDIKFLHELLEKKCKFFDLEPDCSNMFEPGYYSPFEYCTLQDFPYNYYAKKIPFLLPKNVIYFISKTQGVSKDKKKQMIKYFKTIYNLQTCDILNMIIKMKDQVLVEYCFI
jgi:hypothetical protein